MDALVCIEKSERHNNHSIHIPALGMSLFYFFSFFSFRTSYDSLVYCSVPARSLVVVVVVHITIASCTPRLLLLLQPRHQPQHDISLRRRCHRQQRLESFHFYCTTLSITTRIHTPQPTTTSCPYVSGLHPSPNIYFSRPRPSPLLIGDVIISSPQQRIVDDVMGLGDWDGAGTERYLSVKS